MAEVKNILEVTKDMAKKFLDDITKYDEMIKNGNRNFVDGMLQGNKVINWGIKLSVATDVLLDCMMPEEEKEKAFKKCREALMKAEVKENEKRNECY